VAKIAIIYFAPIRKIIFVGLAIAAMTIQAEAAGAAGYPATLNN
jgi:hypothetical protein